jgi:hypothetical protein
MVRSPLPRHRSSGIQCVHALPVLCAAPSRHAWYDPFPPVLPPCLSCARSQQPCSGVGGALPAAPSGGHKLVAHRRPAVSSIRTTVLYVRRCYQGQDHVRHPFSLARSLVVWVGRKVGQPCRLLLLAGSFPRRGGAHCDALLLSTPSTRGGGHEHGSLVRCTYGMNERGALSPLVQSKCNNAMMADGKRIISDLRASTTKIDRRAVQSLRCDFRAQTRNAKQTRGKVIRILVDRVGSCWDRNGANGRSIWATYVEQFSTRPKWLVIIFVV